MKPFAFAAMLALCAALPPAGQALAQEGARTIHGAVVDSANHKPISQAAIYLGRTATGQRTA